MADGTNKTLEQVKADAVEVSAQDIIDYNNTLTRVNELVKAGTLVKCQQQFGGAVPVSYTHLTLPTICSV